MDLSNKWAGGGYVSTAGDLLKFARAHLRGTHLSPEARDLIWTPQTTLDGMETHQGIGWQVVPWPGGGTLLVAGGSAIGGTAVVFVFPEPEVVVVFLTNMGNAPIRGVPIKVARILLGENGGQAVARRPSNAEEQGHGLTGTSLKALRVDPVAILRRE